MTDSKEASRARMWHTYDLQKWYFIHGLTTISMRRLNIIVAADIMLQRRR